MLIEGLDAPSAAFEVGYESPSQFNREYKRFFGQPPIRHQNASVLRIDNTSPVTDSFVWFPDDGLPEVEPKSCQLARRRLWEIRNDNALVAINSRTVGNLPRVAGRDTRLAQDKDAQELQGHAKRGRVALFIDFCADS